MLRDRKALRSGWRAIRWSSCTARTSSNKQDGTERERLLERGKPIEFPTRRRGYYSWHSFCKTQYAGNPKLGGEANFLKAHLSLIELFDQMRMAGVPVRVRDDSKYAKHRDVDRLLRNLREWDALVAHFVGRIGDALNGEAGSLVAPIRSGRTSNIWKRRESAY